MGKVKYLFTRIKNMNYGKFFDTIKKAHQESHKNSIIIFFDIIYCGFKYMAGYVDYECFKMYQLNKEQRKAFVTRGVNNNYVKALNNPEELAKMSNKIYFNKNFSNYLKRDWIYTEECTLEEWKAFIKKHPIFIIKPTNEMCGNGVEKVKITKDTDINSMFKELKEKKMLVEECIYSHDEIAKLNPNSLNTLRVVTIRNQDKVQVMFTGLKIGNGKEVDNFNNHGLLTFVDSDGIIRRKAIDKKGDIYEIHPLTKEKIVGFKVPKFEEALEIAKQCASQIDKVRYIGFDVAITNEGALIIEANPYPGYDLYQSVPGIDGNLVGLKKFFDEAVYGIEKK